MAAGILKYEKVGFQKQDLCRIEVTFFRGRELFHDIKHKKRLGVTRRPQKSKKVKRKHPAGDAYRCHA